MKEKNKRLVVSAIAGFIGGAFGAVSGSNSWVVVALAAGFIAAITAWLINGMVK